MTQKKATPEKEDAGIGDTGPDMADIREREFEAREAALEAREREVDTLYAEASARIERAREAELARAPREREHNQSSRSRAMDDTARMERASMDVYAPPSMLEVPKDPEYHFRWIAEWVNGQQTPRNVQQRLREGYVRVRQDELPEDFLVDEDLSGDGYARTSGLILMRIPLTKKVARDVYYARKSQERLSAADQLQGIAGRNAVREDRGSRSLTGADAQHALQTMSRT